jgi:hypothetical protein
MIALQGTPTSAVSLNQKSTKSTMSAIVVVLLFVAGALAAGNDTTDNATVDGVLVRGIAPLLLTAPFRTLFTKVQSYIYLYAHGRHNLFAALDVALKVSRLRTIRKKSVRFELGAVGPGKKKSKKIIFSFWFSRLFVFFVYSFVFFVLCHPIDSRSKRKLTSLTSKHRFASTGPPSMRRSGRIWRPWIAPAR